jgi:hypothetical protein
VTVDSAAAVSTGSDHVRALPLLPAVAASRVRAHFRALRDHEPRYDGDVRFAVVLVLLTACYKPGYDDCEITCTAAVGCPAGLDCQAGFCRSAGATGSCTTTPVDSAVDTVDADPAGDPDMDGHVTANDNCPLKANADQANEDGDAFGDVCDPCPPFAGVDNLDNDGDTVGNGCDPNPGTPGERIEAFFGFATAATPPPPPAMVVGSWSFGNGIATTSSPPLVTHAIGWPTPQGRSIAVLSKLTVRSLSAGMSGGGVIEALDPAMSSSEMACEIGRGNTGGTALVLLSFSGGSPVVYDELPVPPSTIGTPVLLDLKRDGGTYKCSTDALGSSISTTTAMVPTNMPYAGVFSNGATVDVQWVLVISLPPTP